LLNQGVSLECKIILFLFSFIDPVIAVALVVSFVIDTVKDESTTWYKFERESLMACLVEVSTWTTSNHAILTNHKGLGQFNEPVKARSKDM